MGCTLFTSFIYVFINLAVDVIYVTLDPRISY
jgi:ABC-type dipeptide/oligopeptide/nickel transport system permease component